MTDEPAIAEDAAEEARAAIHDGIERARELICEAKLAMRQQEAQAAKPRRRGLLFPAERDPD